MPAITRAFAWTHGIAAALSIAALSGANPAKAIITVTTSEVGSDVVFSYSGSANTTSLTYIGPQGSSPAGVGAAGILIGQSPNNDIYGFVNTLAGPFSTLQSTASAFSSTGDSFGFTTSTGLLLLPGSYISGTSMSGSSTYQNTTLTGLGITPGTYTYTWGTGPSADSAVLTFSGAPSPGPAAAPGPLPLFGAAAAYTWSRRLRRRCGRG